MFFFFFFFSVGVANVKVLLVLGPTTASDMQVKKKKKKSKGKKFKKMSEFKLSNIPAMYPQGYEYRASQLMKERTESTPCASA